MARALGGEIAIEYDTGEWSVDIGFPGHRIAIEVHTLENPECQIAHLALLHTCNTYRRA